MQRRDPNLTDMLGALIIAHFGIPREVAKTMTRREILGLLEWDHDPVPVAIAVGLGWGPDQYNHPSNLTGRLSEDHGLKTARIDIPQIAKAVRISDAHVEFQRRILAKSGQVEPSGTGHGTGQRNGNRWPKGRKLQSKPFAKREDRQ